MPTPRSLTIDFDVAATMRDGTVLRANVYRPDGPGPWPALLCRTPYGKDFALAGSGVDVGAATRRGFLVVIQDTRGRFGSDGDWAPMVHEADDGVDTVAWLAEQPDCDGTVSMYGASYLGFTQWATAAQRPPALRAIAPFVTWSDPEDGLLSRGGALELGLQVSWHMGVGVSDLARRHPTDPAAVPALVADYDALADRRYFDLPLVDLPALRDHSVGAEFLAAARRPPDEADPLLQATSVHRWHDQIEVPSLNIGGWYDLFLGSTIANFTAQRERGARSRLLIGPWSHQQTSNLVGEQYYGFAAQSGFLDLRTDLSSVQLDFFEQCRGNEESDEPPIWLFVLGRNQWRTEAQWPLARARTVPYFLGGGGVLTTELTDPAGSGTECDYDPADPAPTVGGATLLSAHFRSGPHDQRRVEQRADVLTFTTEPLEADLEVTGPIEVRLWASSSAPDTDFVARLCDVFPDGRSVNLTDGIIRARYRAGRAESVLLEPERPYEFDIDLWATSNVFAAGHRIRVDITFSSFPRWDRNPNTGHAIGADAELAVAHQRIWHDSAHPSRILLPVVD